jgi:signal transduction histidine kinase
VREELRRREIEVQQLSAIIAAIDHGVIMQDKDGRIQVMNDAARTLLGGVKAFWETELGTLFQRFQHEAASGSGVIPLGEPVKVQVNNRIVGAQFAALADDRSRRIGSLILLKDVTSDVISERLKEQFITAISHELRTPMTVIKGISEVLIQTPADQPPNRKLLEALSKNVDVLDRMVVELLDVSDLETSSFTVRADVVEIEPLLWATVRGLTPETTRGRLDIGVMTHAPDALRVRGDEAKLQWALGHILQNSIRYTEPGGHIFVIVNAEDSSTVSIAISDTGVGISERDLPHVFDRFYRGEARNTAGKLIDPRGLGQGLFIARKVIEAHGGYLTVQSAPGQGSTFTMKLPAL